MEQCEKKQKFFYWLVQYCSRPSNKRVEFKFMKEIKPCYFSSMPEMVAELNAKMPAEPKNINLHLDGFDIRFDYHSFSNKSIVTMSHGVSLKMAGSDLAGIQGE